MVTYIKDVDMIILSNLAYKELEKIRFVNKYIFGLCNNKIFWRNKLKEFSFSQKLKIFPVYIFKINEFFEIEIREDIYLEEYKTKPRELYFYIYNLFKKYGERN